MPLPRWRRCATQRRLPIFVGGSGLYFKALTRGLSAVPPIPAEVREGVRAQARARRRRGAARRTGAARSSGRRTPETARPHPHRACARSGGGDRPFAGRLASRGAAAAAAAGRVPRAVSWPQSAISSMRGSTRDLMRCWKRARCKRSPALASRKLDPQLPAMKAHWRAGADPAH